MLWLGFLNQMMLASSQVCQILRVVVSFHHVLRSFYHSAHQAREREMFLKERKNHSTLKKILAKWKVVSLSLIVWRFKSLKLFL